MKFCRSGVGLKRSLLHTLREHLCLALVVLKPIIPQLILQLQIFRLQQLLIPLELVLERCDDHCRMFDVVFE